MPRFPFPLPNGWFNLGYALHYSGNHAEAVGAFENAAELEFRSGTATYNVACANAMLGRTDAALDALERAAESGAIHRSTLYDDEDLESLRDEPRFQALADQLDEKDGHDADSVKTMIKRMLKEVTP